MRNLRIRSLTLLALLLLVAPAARAALHQEGAPLLISTEARCSFTPAIAVTSTPKGAFDVLWVDGWEEVVKSQRFARNLAPSPVVQLLPLHGGLNAFYLVGAWAGRYEWVMNVEDYGNEPADPWAAYRVQLDAEGDPLAAPSRIEIRNFFKLAPAKNGDSLQIRIEPPYFGPLTCQSTGLLARRVALDGAPLSPESRVTRKASAWAGGGLVVDRLANDNFVVAYSTCEKFFGVVVRRLSPTGVPVGKPINLPLPTLVSGNLALAARGGSDFAVASTVRNPSTGALGTYTHGVVDGKVFGPTRLTVPAGFAVIGHVVDMAASSNGYVLLFVAGNSTPQRRTIFAQQLDAQGAPVGAPVAVTGETEFGQDGAVASLPDNRWIVVTRSEHGIDLDCRERIVGTVLGN